jgi:GNAT superfamily N-acetyltransferase
MPFEAARVHIAHADAWAAQGRLREPYGGGVLEAPGLRLMASGLPQVQWNGADVTAADADLEVARAFYAARGAAWGVRVPVAVPWRHGRHLRTVRLMALGPEDVSPAPPPPGVTIRRAAPGDLDAVVGVDAIAFDADPAVGRPWLAPHLDAPGIDVALATLDGEAVATGYSVRTDERAGPCLFVAGVAVLPAARGRGVGAALSSWLVERGFAAGADLAHLHADTSAAARVYARLGFQDAEGMDVYVAL